MKKSQEIIGLPVFSILDGREIGQVKDLVVNPEEGKVYFILVSNGSRYAGARVLPYSAVMGVGEHAVTTESANQLTSITENSQANSLLERNIEVIGSRVLTDKGNFIGVISEYEVDEESGALVQLQYKPSQDESQVELIEAEQVLTYGSDVVVIKESSGSPSKSIPSGPAGETVPTESDGATYFKQKQREFLVGKKVIQDIKDAAGQIIIAAGSVVTEDIINLAENNGKFTELSECVK